MFKIIISIILCSSLCLFSVVGNCQVGTSKEQKLQNNNIEKMDISITIKPIKDSQYCYNFTTNVKSQIDYIIHMLNAIDYVDDGKFVGGGDIPIVNINLTKLDSSIDKYGFVSGRFYDTTDKQYAVDRNDYQRFLDFIYALKTDKLVLDGEVTFEPSEWAKEDVNKAIEYELVPKLNQINYTGKVNRLEVCQIIDNLLEKQSITEPESTENPFSDTSDKSVTSLYSHGVIHGKTDNMFLPYDYITREEFAKILGKTYDVLGLTKQTGTHTYADETNISDWAKDSVSLMYQTGIMNGKDNNEFKPKDTITKEEAITAILRLSDAKK